MLHYNLACYWSLAGNGAKAVDALSTALEIDPELRSLIAEERDFDQLRGTPEFDRLVMGSAPDLTCSDAGLLRFKPSSRISLG